METTFYIVVGVVCLVVVAFFNNAADNRCVEKGGQIIHNSTKLNHSCILAVGKK